MSETANTLIKAAYRAIGIHFPTSGEMADGLEALQFMLRSWSGDDLPVHYIAQDTLGMSGAASYTIGSGGDCNTTRPVSIKGAVVDDIYELRIVDDAWYRRVSKLDSGAPPAYLYYKPDYPLGVLYPYPTSGSSMVIDSLKELTDPAALTSDVEFPVWYDAAIKWNLAVDLAPEHGRIPSNIVLSRAGSTKRALESKNFSEQLNATILDLVHLGRNSSGYNIDEG